MKQREARHIAADCAASIISGEDLDSLFGPDIVTDDNETALSDAQEWIVGELQKLADRYK